VVYRDRGYFGAKSRSYDATMKRAVKEHSLRMSDILRDKIISSKRVQMERVYAVTKKMFKAGKFLATTVQRVNLKMLFTVFCSNLYHLITLKIKGIS
jgi:IS5 family transposase